MTETRLQEPEWIFPFDGMDIGDSFFVPTVRPAEMLYKIDTCAKQAKVRVKAYISSKEGHLGVRVWWVG
jgi:ethanolamine utilization microcompartment shell protein EutL